MIKSIPGQNKVTKAKDEGYCFVKTRSGRFRGGVPLYFSNSTAQLIEVVRAEVPANNVKKNL
jgi:hypothetical protein